jgi:DNA polymerase beta
MSDFKQKIIESLKLLEEEEKSNKQLFKARAYSKAIQNLILFDKPITSAKDIEHIDGIGDKIYKKVEEIITTGSLKRTEKIKNDLNLLHRQLFENLYGVGPTKSKQIVDEYKVSSISELRKYVKTHPDCLNDKQKIGLKYYEDLILRIPREEMIIHDKYILETIAKYSENKFKCCIVGSYRRKRESSGDIDVLVSPINTTITSVDCIKYFKQIVNAFIKNKYIGETLASGNHKFMGICKLGETNRRLDILFTPISEYATSLVYFTGSQQFNIKMRARALELGYTLNEHSLTPVKDKVPKVPLFETERSLFDFLKMEYVDPEYR